MHYMHYRIFQTLHHLLCFVVEWELVLLELQQTWQHRILMCCFLYKSTKYIPGKCISKMYAHCIVIQMYQLKMMYM